jgi:hypothetical protein
MVWQFMGITPAWLQRFRTNSCKALPYTSAREIYRALYVDLMHYNKEPCASLLFSAGKAEWEAGWICARNSLGLGKIIDDDKMKLLSSLVFLEGALCCAFCADCEELFRCQLEDLQTFALLKKKDDLLIKHLLEWSDSFWRTSCHGKDFAKDFVMYRYWDSIKAL